jgi:hypothetical protein
MYLYEIKKNNFVPIESEILARTKSTDVTAKD